MRATLSPDHNQCIFYLCFSNYFSGVKFADRRLDQISWNVATRWWSVYLEYGIENLLHSFPQTAFKVAIMERRENTGS